MYSVNVKAKSDPAPVPGEEQQTVDSTTAAFLREVDDALHEERMKSLWDTWKYPLIAALVVLFAAVAGWQWWSQRQMNMAQQAADAWYQVTAEQTPEQQALLAALGENSAPGIEILALMRQARLASAAGNHEQAQAFYTQAQQVSAPVAVKDLLQIQQAMSLMNVDPVQAESKLAAMDREGFTYRGTALEMLAELSENKGDRATALSLWRRVGAMDAVPPSMVQRADQRAEMLEKGTNL